LPAAALELPVPAAVAWDLLTDTESWPHWGPSVRAVQAPRRRIGPGMRGRVCTPLGIWLPFEVTHWQDGSAWSWRVAGIEATGHVVAPVGRHHCRVTFTVPSWAPFYLPVCRSALQRLRRLAGEAPRAAAG
jgi:hypothetical protein